MMKSARLFPDHKINDIYLQRFKYYLVIYQRKGFDPGFYDVLLSKQIAYLYLTIIDFQDLNAFNNQVFCPVPQNVSC